MEVLWLTLVDICRLIWVLGSESIVNLMQWWPVFVLVAIWMGIATLIKKWRKN